MNKKKIYVAPKVTFMEVENESLLAGSPIDGYSEQYLSKENTVFFESEKEGEGYGNTYNVWED